MKKLIKSACSDDNEEPTWEKIGFQLEASPETDVRGAGVLGVLILMKIAEANPAAMKELIEGANVGPTIHEYPLALTSFQVTVIQIRLLREGHFKIKKAFGGDTFFSQP